MSQQELQVFRKQYERSLASDAASRRPHVLRNYTRREAWAGGNEGDCRPSGILVPEDLGELVHGDKEHDARNARALHGAIRLTPMQAADPNLWARLAHNELWGYMQTRWKPGDYLVKKDPDGEFDRDELNKKVSLFVQRRYFVAQRNSRHLMRHGVARLWWSAELTRDGDDYKDTETLLWMPETAERQYGQYPEVLRTLLRFIAAKKASLEKKGRKCDLRKNYFRPLLKSLNQHGAHTQLGQLTPEEIEIFLQNAFWQIEKGVRKARKARRAAV